MDKKQIIILLIVIGVVMILYTFQKPAGRETRPDIIVRGISSGRAATPVDYYTLEDANFKVMIDKQMIDYETAAQGQLYELKSIYSFYTNIYGTTPIFKTGSKEKIIKEIRLVSEPMTMTSETDEGIIITFLRSDPTIEEVGCGQDCSYILPLMLYDGLMIHEMSHVIMWNRLPFWADEGLGMYMELSDYSDYDHSIACSETGYKIDSGAEQSYISLSTFAVDENWLANYYTASCFWGYIADTYGENKIYEITPQLTTQDKNADFFITHLENILGTSTLRDILYDRFDYQVNRLYTHTFGCMEGIITYTIDGVQFVVDAVCPNNNPCKKAEVVKQLTTSEATAVPYDELCSVGSYLPGEPAPPYKECKEGDKTYYSCGEGFVPYQSLKTQCINGKWESLNYITAVGYGPCECITDKPCSSGYKCVDYGCEEKKKSTKTQIAVVVALIILIIYLYWERGPGGLFKKW